jgi:hypothetical protein
VFIVFQGAIRQIHYHGDAISMRLEYSRLDWILVVRSFIFESMSTDATGTTSRKPPPAPSARNSSTRQSSVRPARRMSKRPAPLAGLGGSPVANLRQPGSTSAAVTSVASQVLSATQSASVSTSAARDELVRAIMPELRLLVQHLVETTFERSLAPLVEKQRELEAALKEVRSAQVRADQALSAPTKRATAVVTSDHSNQTEGQLIVTSAAPIAIREPVVRHADAAIEQSAPKSRSAALRPASHDASALVDMPAELNGSRRKRVIVWTIAVCAVSILLSVITLSVASNLGTHF